MKENSQVPVIDFDTPQLRMHRKIRSYKDKVAEVGVGVGGISVIIAILLIFLYLMYEVVPLFKSASVEPVAEYQIPATETLPGQAKTLHLAVEEQNEVAMRITSVGEVIFFKVENGQVVKRSQLPVPAGVELTAVSPEGASSHYFALGLSDGSAIVMKERYRITYPNDKRLITPMIEYPFGEEPMQIAQDGSALKSVTLHNGEENLMIAAITADNKAHLSGFYKEESMFGDEVSLEQSVYQLPVNAGTFSKVLISSDQRWLYLAGEQGQIDVVDLADASQPKLNARLKVTENNSDLAEVIMQLGGISLLVSDDSGAISQWFLVRDDQNEWSLTKIRSFEHDATPVAVMLSEHRRKGFLAIDEKGQRASSVPRLIVLC